MLIAKKFSQHGALVLLLSLGASPTLPAMVPSPASHTPASREEASLADLGELIEDHRRDIADMSLEHPVPLGMEAGTILAGALKVGVEVWELIPERKDSQGRQCLRKHEVINQPFVQEDSPYSLLHHEGRFSLLEATLDKSTISTYVYHTRTAAYGFHAADPPQDPTEASQQDGNSLINMLYYLRYQAFPDHQEVARLRTLVAETMDLEGLFESLVTLNKRTDRPVGPIAHLLGGPVPGLGPRVCARLDRLSASPFYQASEDPDDWNIISQGLLDERRRFSRTCSLEAFSESLLDTVSGWIDAAGGALKSLWP